MRTILRRLECNSEEYFCVIDHTLERFELGIKRPWEMSDDDSGVHYYCMRKGQPYRIINSSVMFPDYVSTLEINNDSAMELLDAHFIIRDEDNLFARLSQAFLNITPVDLLRRYPDYTWVFDRKSIYLKSKTGKQIILKPFEQWKNSPTSENTFNYRSSGDNKVLKELLSTINVSLDNTNWLIGTDVTRYNYSVFRTAWYDTVMYLEYSVMYLELLNCIGKLAADWDNRDIQGELLTTPIQRSKCDTTVQILLTKYNLKLLRANNLPEVYDKVAEFGNRSLAHLYKHLIEQLTFTTETQINWEKFNTLYTKYLNIYTDAVLSYMRWNFIRSIVSMPEAYQTPLEIQTSIGKLIVKGGEPVWDS